MDVDESTVAEVVVAPHLLQERFAAEHATGVRCEFHEQAELGLGEVDLLAVAGDRALLGDDLEVGEPHAGHPGVGRPGPSEQRPDPCRQLLRDERFGEVVVGARLEPGDHVVGVGPGGDHDDRHVTQPADGAAHVESVEAGQHDVDEDDVGGLPGEVRDGLLTVGRLRDLPALVLERQLHGCADSFVVLDRQDSCAHARESRTPQPLDRVSRCGRPCCSPSWVRCDVVGLPGNNDHGLAGLRALEP